MNLYWQAKTFSEQLVTKTNHLYDGKPYTVHLDMVEDVANMFIDLIPVADRTIVKAAIRLHDVIEDNRASWNDVVERTNKRIADLVFAVSTNTGKTRKERADDRYYEKIRVTVYATFIKLCDRIANVQYGIENNGKWKMYFHEQTYFKRQLFDEKYIKMFDYLDIILNAAHANSGRK